MTTQNVNALSPVGYLNTVTGHLWSLTEQPEAIMRSGLYEPLVLSREALEIAQQKDALQLSVDNILRGLDITGDGPFSQLVLEKFIALQAKCDALAAEADYLLPKAASELSNAWLLHRTMMGAQVALKCLERGEYSAAKEWLEGTTDEAQLEIPDAMATGELQKWFDENLVGLISSAEALKIIKADIPATDAAIAKIGLKAIKEFASSVGAEAEGLSPSSKEYKSIKSTVFRAVKFAANLRAGRK